jgi:diguanylate cyclase (GGDEF)-like protein
VPAILVAEPASPARDLLERALSDVGYKVRVAGDGEEALAYWRLDRHELVIAADNLPRLGGIELASRVKAEMPLGFQAVILVTEQSDPTERAHALAIVDDVVTRPYDVEEFVARAQVLLRTRRIVEELRIARAESEARSYADPVTGLRNRAFLGERLTEEFKRAMRYNEPLSLILISIEGWNALVEQRGTPFSERLLNTVAGVAVRTLRQIDIVTRYGPCELAALLPNTHLAGSLICAERLLRESSAQAVDDMKPLVAMGIAFFPGKDVADTTDLLRMAARALERARDEGPGSICLYQHQSYLFQPK